MGENDILINFERTDIKPKEEVNGVIKINYMGRFDSIVINSQIENSNDIFTFIKLNDKNQLLLCEDAGTKTGFKRY